MAAGSAVPPAPTTRPIGLVGPLLVVGLVPLAAAVLLEIVFVGGLVVPLGALMSLLIGILVAGLWVRVGARGTAATAGILCMPWVALMLGSSALTTDPLVEGTSFVVVAGVLWLAASGLALIAGSNPKWVVVATALVVVGAVGVTGPSPAMSSLALLVFAVAPIVLVGGVWAGSERRQVPVPPAMPVYVVAHAGAPGTPVVVATPSTNGFAITALILGILGVSLLSVVFGAVALSQIRSSGGTQRGRGMAIWGIVLGVLWTIALVALYVAMYAALGTTY